MAQSSAKARDSTRKLRDVVPANPVLGYAYSGHPVSLLRIGAINVDLLASTVTPEEMVRRGSTRRNCFGAEHTHCALSHAARRRCAAAA